MIPKRLIAAARRGNKNVASQGFINTGTMSHGSSVSRSSVPIKGGGKVGQSRMAFNKKAGFEGGKSTYIQLNGSGYGNVKTNASSAMTMNVPPPQLPAIRMPHRTGITKYGTVQSSTSGVRRHI